MIALFLRFVLAIVSAIYSYCSVPSRNEGQLMLHSFIANLRVAVHGPMVRSKLWILDQLALVLSLERDNFAMLFWLLGKPRSPSLGAWGAVQLPYQAMPRNICTQVYV